MNEYTSGLELCAAYERGRAAGNTEECAHIVAWLRRGDACCVANAERIERGDHFKSEGEDMSEKTTNAVVHPKHYNSGSIEVITAIEDWQLNFSCGNVVKYVVRAPHKGKHLEDLRKAREYLDFEIARVERLEQVALLPAKGNK